MELLLIEDDADDMAALIRLANKTALDVRVTTATTGDEAVDHLVRRREEQEATGAPTPDLVLLDLNLPARPGIEVLRWLKDDGRLREIPVVIVSATADDRAIQQGRELGAHSHITKPITLRSLIWIMTTVCAYRTRVARLNAAGTEA